MSSSVLPSRPFVYILWLTEYGSDTETCHPGSAAIVAFWPAARVGAQRFSTATLTVRRLPGRARLNPGQVALRFVVTEDGLGEVTSQTETVAAWVRALPGQRDPADGAHGEPGGTIRRSPHRGGSVEWCARAGPPRAASRRPAPPDRSRPAPHRTWPPPGSLPARSPARSRSRSWIPAVWPPVPTLARWI